MHINMFMLNREKTQLVVPHLKHKSRNIYPILLTTDKHVNAIAKACYCLVRNTGVQCSPVQSQYNHDTSAKNTESAVRLLTLNGKQQHINPVSNSLYQLQLIHGRSSVSWCMLKAHTSEYRWVLGGTCCSLSAKKIPGVRV